MDVYKMQLGQMGVDIVTALKSECERILKDPKASEADRSKAWNALLALGAGVLGGLRMG